MMTRVQGYCVIHKETKDRWGGLFESEKGAIASFNKTRGPTFWHPSGRRLYWHEQDFLIIVPLVIGE